MTTQTTTMQPSKQSVRALIGMTAATLAVLGGALLWQVRSTSEAIVPTTSTSVISSTEGTVPLGGLAERYHDEQQVAAAAAAAQVTTKGGLAELYAEQAAVATTTAAPAAPVTDQEMYQHWQQRSPATSETGIPPRGGLAELYAEQAAAGVPAVSTCGLAPQQTAC